MEAGRPAGTERPETGRCGEVRRLRKDDQARVRGRLLPLAQSLRRAGPGLLRRPPPRAHQAHRPRGVRAQPGRDSGPATQVRVLLLSMPKLEIKSGKAAGQVVELTSSTVT